MLKKLLYWLVIITAFPADLIYFKRKVYYENNNKKLKNIREKSIIISNHKSIKDYMSLMLLFWKKRLSCLISKVVYNRNKFLDFWLYVANGIKVDRDSYSLSFMKECETVLNNNQPLVIYPEGKLSLTEEINQFSPTYIYLALKTNTPIKPVYTDGNYGLFKRNRVIIGESIDLRKYCSNTNPTKEEIEKINTLVRNKIIKLKRDLNDQVQLEKDKIHLKDRFLWDLGKFGLIFSNLLFKIRLHGNKNVRKLKGGFIIVANHYDFTNIPVIYDVFSSRHVYCLAGEVVFDDKHKLRNKLMKSAGVIRIDRNILDTKALSKCVNVLKNGHPLIVFPEGHINKDALSSIKSGAIFLANMTNVPIVPLYLVEKKQKSEHQEVYLGDPLQIKNEDKKFLSLKEVDNASIILLEKLKELEERALQDGKK